MPATEEKKHFMRNNLIATDRPVWCHWIMSSNALGRRIQGQASHGLGNYQTWMPTFFFNTEAYSTNMMVTPKKPQRWLYSKKEQQHREQQATGKILGYMLMGNRQLKLYNSTMQLKTRGNWLLQCVRSDSVLHITSSSEIVLADLSCWSVHARPSVVTNII